MAKRVLALDLGASGGRAVLGGLGNTGIELREIYRFPNDPVFLKGTMYWDILRLFHEIKNSLKIASRLGGFDSIAIDTWGVDFGLLDGKGELLENPVHYRDCRTRGMMEAVFSKVSKEELYRRTGIQQIDINTIYQLYSIVCRRPELWKRVEHVLFLPDLFNYFLTGKMSTEFTIASTSQLLNIDDCTWDKTILKRLGLSSELFPPLVRPGTVVGLLDPDICREVGCRQVPVIAAASHDTASAVAAVPATEENFVYLSSGTWSLLGTERTAPLVNRETEAFNFTNEGGVEGTTRLLKNIMGLWLVEELRRQWSLQGGDLSFENLEQEARNAAPFRSFINVDSPEFEKPGQMQEKIRKFCARTGQPVPESKGELLRCVYESMAMKYGTVMEELKQITGTQYSTIHVVGGGTKNSLLCSLCADACQTNVLTGLPEATAAGNAVVQWIALGELSGIREARERLAGSFDQTLYAPGYDGEWKEAYHRYQLAIGSVSNQNEEDEPISNTMEIA